jgi:EAL domain-containing protein (putative c-di-GMP-specific phosphodiesterase class I)
MEALLRWNDPDRGLVHPDQFIPAAEEMSLLEPIGEWVGRGVARQIRAWLGRRPRPARVVQRVPARAAPAGLRGRAGARLAGAGVDPRMLTMELTESATLREPERIGPLLRELHAIGLQIAIDDFGRGLVIAVTPASASGADAQDRPLLPARDPGRPRVGRDRARRHRARGRARHDHRRRGVEVPLQQHFLAAQGCALAQGRLFGDALTAAAMTDRLLAEAG